MSTPILLGKKLKTLTPEEANAFSGPDWAQANPSRIQKMLERTMQRSGGGWYALDASRHIETEPVKYQVLGKELVAWRHEGELRVGPNACPHMGAELSCGRVQNDGQILCPWHGLALGNKKHGRWNRFEVFEDGVLSWVRMPSSGEELTETPVLPPRPSRYIDAVIREEIACDPRDVIANRLDPWHGAHFHPYSFSQLKVIAQRDDVLTVRVAYKLGWRFAIEVDATFHCPSPRTIVMTIIDGEGAGSVVETHATPIAPGKTALIELTLASSEREGFQKHGTKLAPVIRPIMEWAARKLWVDDAAYAERTYTLRKKNIEY